LVVGYDIETGSIPSAAEAACCRVDFGAAEQLAEKDKDAASGVKTPDENAGGLSELKAPTP
jgi:hypothetical protein